MAKNAIVITSFEYGSKWGALILALSRARGPNTAWTVALGIHDRAINIFSLKLKPAKDISENVKQIRTNNARHTVATETPNNR